MLTSHFFKTLLVKKLHKMFSSSDCFIGLKNTFSGCTEARLPVTFFPSCVFLSPPYPCPLPIDILRAYIQTIIQIHA